MVEIAICLAIIGIALVAIIGVLPAGINVQKDNREETLIDQDATVWIENIRNGARGLDDLTKYVVAITNSWTYYPPNGAKPQSGVNGYTYANFRVTPPYPVAGSPTAGAPLTNGMNIIGLLSTPEYIDQVKGTPIPNLAEGGISNYVVAYVRSLSGPAVEKPPQDNTNILSDSFSYKMICQNVPVAINTPPLWQQGRSYNVGAEVFWPNNANGVSWRATATTAAGDEPGVSALWAEDSYGQQLTANLRELRLTFLWPLLPNGNTGNGRQTFRTSVAGQMTTTNDYNDKELLYFFQPQTFSSAP
jgi:type II secretory pathway pseudopilin PulG